MNSLIGIKNFRSFNSEGCTIKLNPISILTGTNSSGKSSFVKGILTLNDFLERFQDNGILQNCFLDFSKSTYQLGNYSTVLNHQALKGDVITLSYTMLSATLDDEIGVSISFKPSVSDDFRFAWFDSFSISSKDRILISGSVVTESDPFSGYKSDIIKWDINSQSLRELCLKRIQAYINIPLANNNNELIDDSYNDDIVGKILWGLPSFVEKNFDKNVWDSMLHYDSIFVLPVLEEIGALNIEQFDAFASKKPNYSIWSPIVEAFRRSGKSTFSDFFHQMEKELFKQDSLVGIDSIISWHSTNNTFSGLQNALDLSHYCDRCRSLIDGQIPVIKYNHDNPLPYILNTLLDSEKSIIGTIALPSYQLYQDFVCELTKEALKPPFCGAIYYIPSDKVAIKRLYSNEGEGDSFQRLLVSYLQTKNGYSRTDKTYYPNPSLVEPFSPGSFIDKWLTKFGVGSHLAIENPADGLGTLLRLYKDTYDENGSLLADEGYGISQLVALLISAEICIMKGYSSSFGKRLSLIIEEPEIHLHPRLQSILADLFWELLFVYRIHAIVETHSEYLVRKLQVLCARYAKEKGIDDDHMKSECPISVIYFEKGKGAFDLKIQSSGKFSNEFGPGFFDEAANLAFEIL